MSMERLHKVEMQRVMNGMTNAATRTKMKSDCFEQTKRRGIDRGIHKEKEDQRKRPDYLFQVFFQVCHYSVIICNVHIKRQVATCPLHHYQSHDNTHIRTVAEYG